MARLLGAVATTHQSSQPLRRPEWTVFLIRLGPEGVLSSTTPPAAGPARHQLYLYVLLEQTRRDVLFSCDRLFGFHASCSEEHFLSCAH
jgi:hypothetical protein